MGGRPFGIRSSLRLNHGNSILPLYVPPERVSVKLSYMYVPPPLAPSNVPLPPVYLYVYSLRCEPSSQVSYILSPPLRSPVQVPALFQLLSGMYSYLPTQS